MVAIRNFSAWYIVTFMALASCQYDDSPSGGPTDDETGGDGDGDGDGDGESPFPNPSCEDDEDCQSPSAPVCSMNVCGPCRSSYLPDPGQHD